MKTVAVIPSRTIPQGLSAMFRLDPDGDFKEVTTEMNDALQDVETGEITTAIRSTEIDGVNVQEGEIIALLNKFGSLTLDELKVKAESVAPVQISHTVSKLVANELVIKSESDDLELSKELRNRFHHSIAFNF